MRVLLKPIGLFFLRKFFLFFSSKNVLYRLRRTHINNQKNIISFISETILFRYIELLLFITSILRKKILNAMKNASHLISATEAEQIIEHFQRVRVSTIGKLPRDMETMQFYNTINISHSKRYDFHSIDCGKERHKISIRIEFRKEEDPDNRTQYLHFIDIIIHCPFQQLT